MKRHAMRMLAGAAALALLAPGTARAEVAEGYWKLPALPADVQVVEWIHSDGNQWFDSGVAVDDYTLDTDVQFSARYSSAYSMIFSAYNGESVGGYRVLFSNSSTAGLLITCYGISGGGDMTIPSYRNGMVAHIRNMTRDGFYYSLDGGTESYVANTKTVSSYPGNKLMFFGQGLTEVTTCKIIGSLYLAQIRKGGAVVRNFVPVVSNSVAYAYDLVNGVFYRNQGTGAFTYGPVVTNLTEQLTDEQVYAFCGVQDLPTITNAGGATNVTADSAWLNGALVATGTSATAVSVYWGTSDSGTNAGGWVDSATLAAPQAPGGFSVQATGLEADTCYFYRFCASNAAGAVWSEAAAFITGDVWIEKNSDASEIGPTPGTFTVHRASGATNAALSVSYAVGGTATPGADYADVSGTLVIPAGAAAAPLVIATFYDNLVEGVETVTVTLASGPYPIGAPDSAMLEIEDIGLVTRVWCGDGGDALAGTAANWIGGVAPAAGDAVLLDGRTASNMTWDLDIPLHSWRQEGYTGTVTVATRYGAAGFTNLQIWGDCSLRSGVWAHTLNAKTEVYRLCVTVGGDLYVSNAVIDADGCGYGTTSGPGSGFLYGAVHGGGATQAKTDTFNRKTYGSIREPVNLGSGGYQGRGGGAIRLIVAGLTTLDAGGVIRAHGTLAQNENGSGAGGSVWLTTGRLQGVGAVSANGGNASNLGDGSGGRVAIALTDPGADFSLWHGTNAAFGGCTRERAAAGTVYRRIADGRDSLIIDNNNSTYNYRISTLMPPGVDLNSFDDVIIRRGGALGVRADTALDLRTFAPQWDGPARSFLQIDGDDGVIYPDVWTIDGFTAIGCGITNRLNSVVIGSDGVLTHLANYSKETYKLALTLAGDLTVRSNGAVTVTGRGYAAYSSGLGPGSGGGGTFPGAAHGGTSLNRGSPNTNTYGSVLCPTNAGSSAINSAGGGIIILTVTGTTTVEAAGSIVADGVEGLGPGSGGSVNLRTGFLRGGGSIRADAKKYGNYGTSGYGTAGGGRIAVTLTGEGADFADWTGTITAYGGPGGGTSGSGGAGTVYLATAATPSGAGEVIADDGNRTDPVYCTFTALPALKFKEECLQETHWVTRNKARICLTTNAVIESLALAANGALELGGWTLTVTEMTAAGSRVRSGVYTPATLGCLTDAAGGGALVVKGVTGTVLLLLR